VVSRVVKWSAVWREVVSRVARSGQPCGAKWSAVWREVVSPVWY